MRVVRAGAVRAVLVTTWMWQRGGCNHVVVTSTWFGAAAGGGGEAGVPDEVPAAGGGDARTVQPPGLSLPKSRTHATLMPL